MNKMEGNWGRSRHQPWAPTYASTYIYMHPHPHTGMCLHTWEHTHMHAYRIHTDMKKNASSWSYPQHDYNRLLNTNRLSHTGKWEERRTGWIHWLPLVKLETAAKWLGCIVNILERIRVEWDLGWTWNPVSEIRPVPPIHTATKGWKDVQWLRAFAVQA